jgi:hypothetical protein
MQMQLLPRRCLSMSLSTRRRMQVGGRQSNKFLSVVQLLSRQPVMQFRDQGQPGCGWQAEQEVMDALLPTRLSDRRRWDLYIVWHCAC